MTTREIEARATIAVNKALAAVAKLIYGGAASGWWPTDCPLRGQCPHAAGCSDKPRLVVNGSRALMAVDAVETALDDAAKRKGD